MQNTLNLPLSLENQLHAVVSKAIEDTIKTLQISKQKEWMSLKEGATYAGVSYNTFIKYRVMGLKVCEIDGVKRVSKEEIDNFLKANSY
ncbi:DNA-binding protein [Lysinibacillus xylanilyticus]|uniref:DNA-binding protein n=1 Tax=Lysinibacillus xylanilyticus TaxID=582475 RepID=A0ABV3W0D5_9BACI